MRFFLILICCWHVLQSSAAQEVDFRQRAKEAIISKAIESAANPPKLENDYEKLRLLDNRSVRLELGIGVKDWLEIKNIRKKAFAEQDSISDQYVRTFPKPFNLQEMVEFLKSKECEKVFGLLSVAQRKRFDQLACYVEIAYLGLPQALASGDLGRRIGVFDNQVDWILRKGEEISRETGLSLNRIRSTYHDKILTLLPVECQKKAEEVLGPFHETGDWADARRDYILSESEETNYSGQNSIVEYDVDSDITSEILTLVRHADTRQVYCQN